MRTPYLIIFIILSTLNLKAQKYWTGGGVSGQWNDGNNWSGSTVPTPTDNIILDNSIVANTYTVNLPTISTKTPVNTLTIAPAGANIITLIIPATNTADSGLYVTGIGDALNLNNNAILQNSTGAPAGAVGLVVINNFRINNGGHYIHNNVRGVAAIVSQLSALAGTEKGIFEYDVPTTAAFTTSLTGRKYGTLIFSANAAGGTKSYTGTGASDLLIRGNLTINVGASFNPAMTADIKIAGDILISGNLTTATSTAGTTGRSIILNGTSNQTISGTGNLIFGTNFRNLKISKNATVTLARNINTNNATDSIIVDTAATLNLSTFKIDGNSNFISLPLSHLSIGDPNGINLPGNNSGNIQTNASRNFDTSAIYEYNGTGAQITGTALPSSVKNLIINKPDFNSLTLTNSVNINDTLGLQKGFLTTTSSRILKLRDTTALSSPASNYATCCSINNIGWEKSFINGPVSIEINSTTSKWIPVGKISIDTLFAPVQFIKPNTTAVTNTVEYFAMSYTDTNTNHLPLDHVSKLEYWSVGCNLPSPSNAVQVSLSWRPQSKTGDGNAAHDAQALTDLRIAHYFDDDGAGGNPYRWNIEGGASSMFTLAANSSVQYGFITSNNPMPASTYFTFGTISTFNALPVKLVSFSGLIKNKSIKLNWLVEDESAIDKYIIEKSSDGINFTQLKIINSLKKKMQWNYSWLDEAPLYGWNFYRLKIIDEKNKNYYSKIIKVLFEKNNQLLVYPNPAKNEIYIQLPISGSVWIIDIVNSSGEIVKQLFSSSSLEKINIESLPKGFYIVRLGNHEEELFERFIKK